MSLTIDYISRHSIHACIGTGMNGVSFGPHLFSDLDFARMPDKTDAMKSIALGELKETIRTPSYYVDEDYPARPEIQ